MENIHDGHRKRVREKFLKSGLESFQPHEILELLLFYGIPRVDTNGIAHELLKKFGNISAVFNASAEDLKAVKGMTDNAVALIKLVPQLLNVYSSDIHNGDAMDNIKTATSYFVSQYIGVTDEEIKVCCLDDNLKVISCSTVIKGTVNSAPVNVRKIVEAAYRSNSSIIILAHNHPNGVPVPSQADITITRQLVGTLSAVGIDMIDHIIVGKNTAVSMKNSGYFNILD